MKDNDEIQKSSLLAALFRYLELYAMSCSHGDLEYPNTWAAKKPQNMSIQQ